MFVTKSIHNTGAISDLILSYEQSFATLYSQLLMTMKVICLQKENVDRALDGDKRLCVGDSEGFSASDSSSFVELKRELRIKRFI